MYLLVLSLAIAVLAIGLVTLGFSIPVNEFDTMIVAGTIAAVAGLILLALAAVLRELRRIADALTVRARIGAPAERPRAEPRAPSPSLDAPTESPVPRPRPELVPPTRVAEPVIAEPETVPLSPRPALWPARRPAERPTPRTGSAPRGEPLARSEPEAAPEARANGGTSVPRPIARPEPRPAPLRADSARAEAPARPEPALRPDTPPRSEPAVRVETPVTPEPPVRAEPAMRSPLPVRPQPVGRPDPVVGVEPEPPAWMTTNRQAPGPEPAADPAATERRRSLFDSVWPRGRKATDALPEEPAPDQAPAWEEPHAAHAEPAYEEAPVEILKSGVIDGMAYTLYTDGSIEAQLAQGTVRFASIEALRIHLEKEG